MGQFVHAGFITEDTSTRNFSTGIHCQHRHFMLQLSERFSKNINKGSDESLLINVLEGNRYAKPSACLPLGIIEIGGKMLETNIVKGSDVEITLEVSESRDLKINVVLLMNDQEVKDTFSPSERYVSIEKLKEELRYLYNDTVSELRDLEENENFDTAAKVLNIQKEAEEMLGKLRTLAQNDTGDSKYQLEERKRKLAQQYDLLTQDRKAEGAKKGYFESKRSCESWLYNDPNNPLKAKMEHIIANERQFLASNNISIIKRKAEELDNLAWAMKKKDPQYIISLYHYYSHQDYPDRKKAQLFIEQGEKALDRKNYDELLSVIYSLYALLPPEIKEQEQIRGTGLR